MSIDCKDDEYTLVLIHAWVAICVYAFGLILFNAMLLFCARTAIVKKSPTPLSHAISFLYEEYLTDYFWFDACASKCHMHARTCTHSGHFRLFLYIYCWCDCPQVGAG